MSTERNKVIARDFFLEQDRRKGPLSPELVADDYTAKIGSNPQMTREGHSAFGAAFYAGFSDLYHTIDDVIADENSAAVRFTLRGTHTGDFMGIPATGKPIQLKFAEVFELRDGKIKTMRAYWDTGTLMRQLGLM